MRASVKTKIKFLKFLNSSILTFPARFPEPQQISATRLFDRARVYPVGGNATMQKAEMLKLMAVAFACLLAVQWQ